MEAAGFSETFVTMYHFTLCHVTDDHGLQTHFSVLHTKFYIMSSVVRPDFIVADM
jgi:hypothetical protein